MQAWGGVLNDPAAWAARAEEAGADLIALCAGQRPPGARQHRGRARPAKTVRQVLEATSLPLIVYGPGQREKDNEVLVAAAEEAAGERIALGNCEEKNYRTIVAAALANGHVVIAKTPIDVNLAKQLNILIGDMRMDRDRILDGPDHRRAGLWHRVHLLGHGAAAPGGPHRRRGPQQPMIVTVGYEAWRPKEARTDEDVPEQWGDWAQRGDPLGGQHRRRRC